MCAALSPSNKDNVSSSSKEAKELQRSIEAKISQLCPADDKSLSDEVVDTQIVVSEFIALFDKYREATESRISELEAMEERLTRKFSQQLHDAKEEMLLETSRNMRDQLHSLDEMGFLDVAVSNCLARQQRISGRIQSLRPS